MVATAEGYIAVTFKFHLEDGQYVARCVELGVSTCAKSLDTAIQRIKEATTLYLVTLEEVGERKRVFEEAGIKIMPGTPTPHDVPVCTRADVSVAGKDPLTGLRRDPTPHDVPVCTRADEEFVTARSVRLPEFAFA